ncbi:MAG: signal protein [Sphingomonadaceae bacterium]|nr:signal protein [Sphingomonadaceae bacterium]
MRTRFPTTFRIAALAVLLALSSNLALVGFLYVRTRDQDQAVRERILEEARALAAVAPDSALDKAVRDTLATGDSQLVAERFDRDGRPLAGNVGQLLPPVAMAAGPVLQISRLRLTDEPAPSECGYVVRSLGADGWLLSGRELGERYALQRTIERSLLLALVLSLGLGVGCGLLIARDVGKRVSALAEGVDQVAEVSGGALDRRLPLTGAGDSFDRLAERINRMLDRIERLMNELRLLTDSLAHDLRSPVGRLRARIERAMNTADDGQRDVLLGGVLQETDTLMRIIATVLEIGRSEAGGGREQFAWLDPRALVDELGEMFEPLAEEAGITLEVLGSGHGAMQLFGHEQLLAQAVSNLVDNAMKHAAAGGAMQLFAQRDGETVRLGVADRGPGIAPADREAARRRFGRLDASRSVAGAGLGLTLVEAIAHLHGGVLELDDNWPGLRAQLHLPLRQGSIATAGRAA